MRGGGRVVLAEFKVIGSIKIIASCKNSKVVIYFKYSCYCKYLGVWDGDFNKYKSCL